MTRTGDWEIRSVSGRVGMYAIAVTSFALDNLIIHSLLTNQKRNILLSINIFKNTTTLLSGYIYIYIFQHSAKSLFDL